MFDWFWKFLYSISKSLMQVCDWLIDISMTLIGVKDMTINGEETDFLTYLIRSNQVTFAFTAILTLAIIILVIFAVFAIIRTMAKEEPGVTPGQICVKTFKSILMFLLVPAIMITLVYFGKVFMQAVYRATQEGGANIGSFLFTTFAQDAGLTAGDKSKFLSGEYLYTDTSTVKNCIDLSEFNFIFSWLVSFVIMENLVKALVMFVDRAISIVILYIAAPMCIASNVLDEGARFKAWREQVLTKFLSAYGVLIALNIYIMVTGLVVSDSVHFFDKSILDKVAKILIVIGGAATISKSMSLVASLMTQGGAAEVNDPVTQGAGNAFANKVKAAAGKVAGIAAAPVKLAGKMLGNRLKAKIPALRAASQFIKNAKQGGLEQAIMAAYAGASGEGQNANMMNGLMQMLGGSGGQNNMQPQYNQNNEQQDLLRQALGGNGMNAMQQFMGNQNANALLSMGASLLQNALGGK